MTSDEQRDDETAALIAEATTHAIYRNDEELAMAAERLAVADPDPAVVILALINERVNLIRLLAVAWRRPPADIWAEFASGVWNHPSVHPEPVGPEVDRGAEAIDAAVYASLIGLEEPAAYLDRSVFASAPASYGATAAAMYYISALINTTAGLVDGISPAALALDLAAQRKAQR